MLRLSTVGYGTYTPWRSIQPELPHLFGPPDLASTPPPFDIFDSQGKLIFQLTICFTPSSTSFDIIPRDITADPITLINQALKSHQTTPRQSMALSPRFFQDPSPAHVALKVFGIAVAVGLLILGLLYIIYTVLCSGSGLKFANNPRRRAQDPETGVDAANCSGNPHRPHSVDTLPRYTASDEALSSDGSEHGRTGGGEEVKPPPYTLDAGGPVGADAARSDASQEELHAGVTTPPERVHLQSS